jgi:cytochrome c6
MAIQSCVRVGLVLIFAISFILPSCTSEGNSSQKESENTEVLSGESLYQQHCASCHGTDGKLGLSGAADLSSSTLSVEEINKVIREGRNGMPPMKEILVEQENIDKVSDYVYELKK